MSSKKKIAAVVLTTVALSVGTVGVATASQPKGKSVSVRTTTARTTVSTIANPMVGAAMGMKMGGPQGELTSALAALVTKGTITQAQSDAITAALTAAHAAEAANHGVDHDANDAQRVARETLIATTIGIDAATIKTRLASGETLGAIAGTKKAALISALVAEATKNIDAAVAAGKMNATQATTLKAGLSAHITAAVDAVRGAMGPGKGKHGPGHMDGGMGKNH